MFLFNRHSIDQLIAVKQLFLKVKKNNKYMILESVNFHFWSKCNYNCLYCYSRFKSGIQHLSEKNCQKLICELANAGIKKINFAGGEPTLCSFLGSLLSFSKGLDLTTSIISNGTGISKNFLRNYGKFTDWIDTGPGSMQWDRLLSWKNLIAHQKDFRNYPTFKSNISNDE